MEENFKRKHIQREKDVNNAIAQLKSESYESFSMKKLYDDHYKHIADRLCSNSGLVEVGCGTGEFITRHLRSFPECKLIGVDVADKCIEVVRKKLQFLCATDVQLLVGDSAELYELLQCSSSTPSVHGVIMRGVVHHLAEPEDTFKSVYKSLSDGGQLVILEGNVDSLYRKFVLWIADSFGVEHEASEFTHTSPKLIQKELEHIGFHNVEVSYIPGLFAPVAYLGIGGERFWKVLGVLNSALGRFGFGWWYLLTAKKG